MIQCISNAMETNHSPQCQLPTGKSRCYISILTRNAFVHNCTMHNALHHCTIAPLRHFTIALLHHCTIAPLHNFNAQHDFNARQIVLWKRLVMPFVANIWCWMWGCEDDLRLTSSSMIMLQHARRDPSLSNHQSTPHPPKPALPSSAYDQLTWSHTSDLWSNQTKYPKTATSTFLSPIAFINFATWLTLKI